MTDRAEPGVTPLTAEEWAELRNEPRMVHLYDARRIVALLDAATPRPGLAEAIHRHRDGCNGRPHRRWYRGENKCDTLAALASGTGEPGLDVERLARSLRALEARDELTVADGFLGGRDAGDYVTFATSIAAAYANDKGAAPTPEPK